MSLPFIKFASHTISYIFFMILIIISSVLFSSDLNSSISFSTLLNSSNLWQNYTYIQQKSQTDNFKYIFELKDFHIRKSTPSFVDILITVWVLGLIWQEFIKIHLIGFKDYLNSWTNIVNSAMNILYVASFGLRYYTMYVVRLDIDKVTNKQYWIKLLQNTSDCTNQKDLFESIYWLNNDRYFWVDLDPINMAEGLFAMANLFSFIRICFFLPANSVLGPLQISLGKMISVRFFILIQCLNQFNIS
jgi:hypothetical protein